MNKDWRSNQSDLCDSSDKASRHPNHNYRAVTNWHNSPKQMKHQRAFHRLLCSLAVMDNLYLVRALIRRIAVDREKLFSFLKCIDDKWLVAIFFGLESWRRLLIFWAPFLRLTCVWFLDTLASLDFKFSVSAWVILSNWCFSEYQLVQVLHVIQLVIQVMQIIQVIKVMQVMQVMQVVRLMHEIQVMQVREGGKKIGIF